MNYLTPNTMIIISHYFPSEIDWVADQLESYCEYIAEHISGKTSPGSYERLCFAILKLGKTSKSKLLQAIELGRCDYRDLLVAAGFGNSTTIHHQWAGKIIEKK